MAPKFPFRVLVIALLLNFAHLQPPSSQELTKYLVSVQQVKKNDRRLDAGTGHFCTGALVSSRIVITAAICVEDQQQIVTRPKRLKVVAGTPNRLRQDVTTKVYKLDDVMPHKPFDWRTREHNIALLRLIDAAPQNIRTIKVISLPNEPPTIGDICTVIGWGRLYNYGPLAAIAIKAEMTIVDHAECNKVFGKDYIEDCMLCALPVNNQKKNECRGDIGAPLICNEFLVGIVSRTSDCGSGDKPIIFTDVFTHMEWIHTINAADRFHSNFKIITTSMFVYVMIIY